MARASILILAVVAEISSTFIPFFHRDSFYYHKSPASFFRRSGNEECSVCYENECLALSQPRCDFYLAASEVLHPTFRTTVADPSPSSEFIKTKVDALMMDLVEQASSSSNFRECIPYISQYTNCNKENACLDCKTCSCTAEGRWDCSPPRCQLASPPDNIDHRTLVLVMEFLKKGTKSVYRVRRSENITHVDIFPQKPSHEQINEWMNEGKPLNPHDQLQQEHTIRSEDSKVTDTNQDTDSTTQIDTKLKDINNDNLAFDDVLNLAVDDKLNHHRTSAIDDNRIEEREFNFKHNNIDYANNKEPDEFLDMLDAIEDDHYHHQLSLSPTAGHRPPPTISTVIGPAPLASFPIKDDIDNSQKTAQDFTTEVIIDLLPLEEIGYKSRNIIDLPGKYIRDSSTKDDKVNINNTAFDENNDIIDFNTINVKKREVSTNVSVNNNTYTTLSDNTAIETTTEISNVTSSEDKANVLDGLNNIIESKNQELNNLIYIKDKLMQFLNLTNSECALKVNNSIYNFSNVNFSYYNFDFPSDSSIETARSDIFLTKPLEKLKRDILVVIKDIIVIQQLVGKENFPTELKVLIKAMKHYVHNSKKVHSKFNINLKEGILPNTRRFWKEFYTDRRFIVNNYLTEIIETIDKDMPESNSLDPLSTKSKHIVRRFITKVLSNFNQPIDRKMKDLELNITENLKDVGVNWQRLSLNVVNSEPVNTLYDLKLLHFALESDITKMIDAISLIDFIQYRRLITVGDDQSDRELKRINSDLKMIHGKINKILELRNLPLKRNKQKSSKKPNKKETFFKHIRNLLRDSKRDILKLLRKKVPKSEIVKELAKKKLDQLTNTKLIEYEKVMQKWQKNLNVNNRLRRSAFDFGEIKNRIKNILPKYLRGKVHSGMQNKTKTKHKQTKTKKSNRRQGHRSGKTTPKITPTTIKITTVT